jgi:hypothetical protein
MENIWDYLRGNKLSRRVWNSYEAGVDGGLLRSLGG